MTSTRFTGAALAVLALSAGLPACAPLLIGGAAIGGTMMAADRRTSGAQIDDQGIELKAGSRIKEAIGGLGHVNVTSFNRTVLLTGQVSSEAEKAAAEAAVAKIENVRSTINELSIGANSSFAARSSDSLITTRVKASFIDARDIFASAYKVVTERGAVYLMGRVTEREAIRASEIARGVSGVTKVVKAFDIITEAELAQSQTAVKDQPNVETATPTPR